MKIIGNYGDNVVEVQHTQGAIEKGDNYKMVYLSQENGKRQNEAFKWTY
jgi:hypothetical protein